MRAHVSNHKVSVNSAVNNNASLDTYLQNGRRLHDKEIGKLLGRFAAKIGGVFGSENYSYQNHAGSRA